MQLHHAVIEAPLDRRLCTRIASAIVPRCMMAASSSFTSGSSLKLPLVITSGTPDRAGSPSSKCAAECTEA